MSQGPERWERDRLDEVVAIVTDALPDERLLADEIEAGLFDDDDTVVLGLPDGHGVVAVAIRNMAIGETSLVVATLKLIAVAPRHRRQGAGRRLLSAAERVAAAAGATELHLAGSAPFYFWPGVDVRFVGMLCLAEACGYRPVGAELNMSLPATFRAPCPAGSEVRRVLDDREVAAVTALVRRAWPWWEPEVARAIDQGGCLGAFASADATGAELSQPRSTGGVTVDADGTAPDRSCQGFVCHSVNRAGWIGPMGTDPDRQHRGLGSALLGEACRDLMIANHKDVEISWVGPVRFYAKTGATVSRVFRTFTKSLAGPRSGPSTG